MQRFQDSKPIVKKVSQAERSADGVFDIETHQRGLIFSIGKIEKINQNTVKVFGGYFEAGLSASGNTYTVKRKGKKWTVTNSVMNWIS